MRCAHRAKVPARSGDDPFREGKEQEMEGLPLLVAVCHGVLAVKTLRCSRPAPWRKTSGRSSTRRAASRVLTAALRREPGAPAGNPA